jgi:hypothetical protein
MTSESAETVVETAAYVDVCLGCARWQDASGRYLVEKDYRVAGEVWRVHKNDADPFPSIPHAHCVGGAKRFVGCTLHLGTAELFRGRTSVGRFLARDQFAQLVSLIRPKFPDVELPLA